MRPGFRHSLGRPLLAEAATLGFPVRMTAPDPVVFGVVLVVLALALNARLKDGSPAIVQTATAFGLIWAGLVIASGMIANIGNSTVVELYSENQDQAVML